MPFAIDTVSGQQEIVKSFEKHYAALRDIKFSIDNKRPVQCVKAIDQKKKRKQYRPPKKNTWVNKTKKRVRQIKKGRKGAIDNAEPEGGRKLTQMITSARKHREKVNKKEHAERIRKMKKNMSESHIFSQRRKNYFDSKANPVKLFRRRKNPAHQRKKRHECLQGSSNFLGDRLMTNSLQVKGLSRPQTASLARGRSRQKRRRPKSASARPRSRADYNTREEFGLMLDDDVLQFQNKIVDNIMKKRMFKEQDILKLLVDMIAANLHLEEEDLLAVAKFICNEFGVGIHKLHLLLSLKLQMYLNESDEEEEPKRIPKHSRKQNSVDKVTIPRIKNDDTQEIILASPEKQEVPMTARKKITVGPTNAVSIPRPKHDETNEEIILSPFKVKISGTEED